MKRKIEVIDYEIYNEKILNNNIKIVHLSDIHFSSLTNINNLNNIKDTINKIKPNYICITGDNIDSPKFLENNKLMDKFYQWIHNLGIINHNKIPVLISIGNHDQPNTDNNNEYKILYNNYLKKLSNSNVHILDSSYYEDKNVFISGFTYPKELISSGDLVGLKEFYDNLSFKLLNASKKKINIALIHSPINLTNGYIKDKLKNYDLILSGHMHNGLIPPFIDKLLKNNYGLISPNKSFFPKVARGKIKLDKNRYLIISGGVTKLSLSSGIFHYANIIYPISIENIVITGR